MEKEKDFEEGYKQAVEELFDEIDFQIKQMKKKFNYK